MKNLIIASMVLLLSFSMTANGQGRWDNPSHSQEKNYGNDNGKGKKGKHKDDEKHHDNDWKGENDYDKHNKKGRSNLILPHGNIGLGTLHPDEKLEVIGNVKVSNNIYAEDLFLITLKAKYAHLNENLTVGKDVFIGGNVGIGVENPADRLEIGGNLRVSDAIYSGSFETGTFIGAGGLFNENLAVKQDLTVEGLTGLGVANPTERLEVGGNIRASQLLYASGIETGSGLFTSDVTLNQNLFVNGNLGLGVASPSEKLDVAGNAKVSGTYFGQSLEVNSIKSQSGYFSQNLNVDGMIGISVENPSEKLDVGGNIRASEKIISAYLETGSGDFSADVNVTGNGYYGGNLGIGVAGPVEKLEVDGNMKVTGEIVSESMSLDNFSVTRGHIMETFSVDGETLLNGNVGIGVSEPTERLDVNGNIKASDKLLAPRLETGSAHFSNDIEVLGSMTLGQELAVGGNASFSGRIGANSDLLVGGSLGIGVASPEAALHVGGASKFEGDITAQKLVVQELQAVHVDFGASSEEPITFNNNIFVDGNIGIGTSSPDSRLTVAGKIHAQEIKITTNAGADFVFEADYPLRNLDEVEQFIQENKHLPDIPSEKEMIEDGLTLGEMNIKLLQKVEELTLYVIDQNKRLKKLTKEHEEQAKRLAKLEGK